MNQAMHQAITMLYFAEDGTSLEALRSATLDQLMSRRKSINDLRKEYHADAVLERRSVPVGLAWLVPKSSTPVERHGLIYVGQEVGESTNDVYHHYRADRRFKLGRELSDRFRQFLPLSGSALLCKGLKADDVYICGAHPGPTGSALYHASAGITKGRIVLKVPTTPEEPFSTPAGMVQIKHSEFIALTEE